MTLPGGPLTFLQIVIGIVDLGCCAPAMYLLLPDQPHIDFVMLAVIFVSATLLGFASHSPGGLGVFDAAMLVALWQFDKEDLLASLLLFRLLYYIIPFALALAILGGREIIKGMVSNRVPQLGDIAADVLVAPPAGERSAAGQRVRTPGSRPMSMDRNGEQERVPGRAGSARRRLRFMADGRDRGRCDRDSACAR